MIRRLQYPTAAYKAAIYVFVILLLFVLSHIMVMHSSVPVNAALAQEILFAGSAVFGISLIASILF